MLAVLMTILTLIYILFVFKTGFISIKSSEANKGFLVCSALFIPGLFITEVTFSFLWLEKLVNAYKGFICCFFSSSNHFLISYLILTLFSILMVIRYRKIKIGETFAA